jgi:cytochrome c-type biogenesis protein CcmF
MDTSLVPALGRGLVLSALLFAVVGSVAGVVAGLRGSLQALRFARRVAYAFAAASIAANALMVYALLTHDFSVHYVASVGSRSTPLYFTIVSLWASLEGSILFWAGVLGVYVAAWVRSMGEAHRRWQPWALSVALAIAVFFSLLVASIANPFAPVFPVPTDGPGPNPLLQNHWLMALHPPSLYLGYVGMSIPYAMLAASLLAGALDAAWLRAIRTWMMIPWSFLSVGIVLGGWWSYEVLGWGGAWAWDPVENASFHPWLTGTAFLHSLMVLERRGALRDWTFVLGLSTFLLTLVGTFMTRSGVFNSVHSFTQSDIGPVFLAFTGIVLTASVLLLAFRAHRLDDPGGAPDLPGPVSRENAIVLQNALFTVFTFTVLLGTLYPLVTEALEDRRVSVGEPFFDRWALPLGVGLVFLMGVGPALPWGRSEPGDAARRLRLPTAAAALAAVAAVLLGFGKPITVLALAVAAFAAASNGAEMFSAVAGRRAARGEAWPVAAFAAWTRGRRRFGGQLAHFGVVAATIALALSKGYREERDVHLALGQSIPFREWTVTFARAEAVAEPHRSSLVAHFDVARDGVPLGVQSPRLNQYPRQREPVFTPSVREMPAGDLYLSLLELAPDRKSVVVRVIWMPAMALLWMSGPLVAIGAVVSMWPSRRKAVA